MARAEKKATREQRTIVFVDESGFYLLAALVMTWAPRGQTPILKYKPYERLSVISAMTPAGKLLTSIQEKSFDAVDIVKFLRHLLRHITGKLLVIWDGLPAHRSRVVKTFLRDGGGKRIHLERLPSYAPDLNPDEGVWHYLKHVEMRNLCCHDLHDLKRQLRNAIARLRRKGSVIKSFMLRAGLDPDV